MNTTKVSSWEEALDQLVEEKRALREALDNIVTLWEMEAAMPDLENACARGRHLLDIYDYEMQEVK